MAGALKESEWKKLCKDNPSATDPGLADALKEYAKTQGKDVDQQLEALEEVVEMAEEAKKVSIKSKAKEVTRYLDGVLTEARQEIERLENEEQDPVDFLDDEAAYKNYLKKVMKKLTKKPMYFAAGLGRKPEEHKIIFHKSHDGKKLLKSLKDATDLKKFAWGLAGGHAERKSTLTLALEGPQISGIKDKGEKLLKYYKPLPFDTILLMVEGEIVEDLPDPDGVADEAELAGPTPAVDATTTSSATPEASPAPATNAEMTRFTSRLKALKPSIDAAIAATNANPQIKVQVSEIAVFARQKEFAQADALLDVVEQLLKESATTEAKTTGSDAAARFSSRLKSLKPDLNKALATGTPAGLEVKQKAGEAATFARQKDFEQALRVLDDVERLVRKSLEGNRINPPETTPSLETAMAQWTAARGKVIADLKSLERGIREMNDPDGDAAIILVKAIQANLSARPDTTQAVAELERYLTTDSIVAEAEAPNGFGIRINIVSALLPPLGSIRAVLAA
jgi:hypothetical protein